MMRTEHEHEQDWGGPDQGGFGAGGFGNGDHGPRLPRFLSGGEDPTMWSIPLYRIGRLHVRAHWVWIVGLVLSLLLTVPLNTLGPSHVLTAMGWGVLLVLIREHFRHLVSGAGRSGENVAVLWDFGPMNLPEVDGGPARPMLHAIGGSILNLVLIVPTAALVLAVGGTRDVLIFNPSQYEAVVGGLGTPRLAVAWWLYVMNLGILGANLLPMLPMDAARAMLVQREKTLGREQALVRVARLGMYVAGATLVAAVAVGSGKIAATALVGAFVCWMHTSRARLLGIDAPRKTDSWGDGEVEAMDVPEPIQKPARQPEPEPAKAGDAEVVDRILEKISREGMGSLTAAERKALEEATKRRREGRAP